MRTSEPIGTSQTGCGSREEGQVQPSKVEGKVRLGLWEQVEVGRGWRAESCLEGSTDRTDCWPRIRKSKWSIFCSMP